MSTKEAIVVLTTVGDEEAARDAASRLVEEGLAACVSWQPVTSVYRWKGQLEEEAECLLIIKTSASCWQRLESRVRELSSYDTPEVLALDVSQASEPYLAWLLSSVSAG